jgi:hypothetical protein
LQILLNNTDDILIDSIEKARIPSENILSDDIPTPVYEYIKNNYSFLDGRLVYHDNNNKYLKVIDDRQILQYYLLI